MRGGAVKLQAFEAKQRLGGVATGMTKSPAFRSLGLSGRGATTYMPVGTRDLLAAYASSELAWRVGVVLVVDVVESVRLTEVYQGRFVTQWLNLRGRIEDEAIRPVGGRLVKSLGDGVLAAFDNVRAAVSAALTILRLTQGLSSDEPVLAVRMGLEAGEFLADDQDVYGTTANLAARLCALADPGGIVVSAAVHAGLVDAIDADIEDLGPCHLKHFERPIHAFRLSPPGSRTLLQPGGLRHDLVPAVAVIPFVDVEAHGDTLVLGDVIADTIIQTFSRSQHMNVISRLSSAVFRWRRTGLSDIGDQLGAKYVVSGSYGRRGANLLIRIELAETRSGQVILQERLSLNASSLVTGDAPSLAEFMASAMRSIMARELDRARRQPMPSLESYSLLLAAIGLMHKPSHRDFDYGRLLLETLVERLPRESMPKAWLAVWYTIKVQLGRSEDPEADGSKANELALRALDFDPESSLALSVCGLIHTNFLKSFDAAERYLDLAIASNPSDSLAILHKSALYQFTDRGKAGYGLNLHARALSPRDPHRYYYDAIAASCAFSAGDYELALMHATESARCNRGYASAARVRAASLWQLGRHDEARSAAEDLLAIQPNLTVTQWLRWSPAADFDVGKRLSHALKQAGVPD